MLKYVLVLNICRRCLLEPAVNLLLSHYIQSIRDDLLRAPLHFGTESKWPKNEPHIGTQSVHQQVNKWPKNERLTHKYCERCPSTRSGNICRRWAWLLWWNFQSILNINFHKKGQCHIIFRASAMETTRKDIITLFSEHQRWKCGSNCIQKVFWGAQVQASPSTPSSPLPRVLIVCTLFRQKTLWRWKITFLCESMLVYISSSCKNSSIDQVKLDDFSCPSFWHLGFSVQSSCTKLQRSLHADMRKCS